MAQSFTSERIISSSDNNIDITTNVVLTLSSFGSSSQITIFANATAGNIIVQLPLIATWLNKNIRVVKTDASVNSVTVKGNGIELINASNTDVISNQFQSNNYSPKSGLICKF